MKTELTVGDTLVFVTLICDECGALMRDEYTCDLCDLAEDTAAEYFASRDLDRDE